MKRKTLIPLLMVLLLAVSMNACNDEAEEDPNLASIEYTISSQEDGILADIEYVSGFGLLRLEDEPLPWSISFKAVFELGDELTLKAESGDQNQMSALITVDDTVVASGSGTHLVQLSYIKGLK